MKLQRILILLPIILLLSIFVGQAAFGAVGPDDFVKPPSNYEPMNIFIRAYNFMGLVPVKDDKIGIFNAKSSGDTLCVGVVQMTKDFSEYAANEYIHVIAYKEYKENGAVIDPGFTEADTIKFYHLVNETQEVVAIPDSNVIYFHTATGEELPDPALFLGRSTALVEIHSGASKLTINVNPEDMGETIPKADDYIYSVSEAEVVTIKVDSAKTAEHYKFSHWTVDGVDDASAEVQVTMDENHTVTANFVLTQYTLSAIPQPSVGEVIPATPTLYDALTWVDIFAKPAEGSGYKFSHWESDPVDADVEDSTQASTRVKMLSDVQMTAIFTLEKDSLFIQIDPLNSGTTSPTAGELHVYNYGVEVALTATPMTGYTFKHWLEHKTEPVDTMIVLSIDSPFTIVMESSRSIYAVFEKEQVTLNLQIGTVAGDIYIKMPGDSDSTKAGAQYTMDYGAQVELFGVSTDDAKYPFFNWTGDVAAVDENPMIVTVDSTMTIIANFEDTTPVELASFTVQYAANSVSGALLLKWQTASETNNLGFDVERSIGNDSNWEKIGFLKGYGTVTDAK